MDDAIIPERIRLKRVYEPAMPEDGMRILVDRLWPRGLSKDEAAIVEWVKDVSPSNELRSRFHHDPELWDEFRKHYAAELADKAGDLARLRDLARKGTVTLVYAARDETHNNAVALREILLSPAGQVKRNK